MMVEQSPEAMRERFAELLKNDFDYTPPRRGEVRKAVVLSVGDNDLAVDLGGKRDGFIAPDDLEQVDTEYVDSLKVGDRIPVKIMREARGHTGIDVSLKQGLEQQDWLRAQDLLDSGKVIEAEVNGVNRGGVTVTFGRLRGFVPNSHLTSVPRSVRGKKRREAKENLVGKTLALVVIEVNQRRRRLVLSERVAHGRLRQQLLEELEEGQERTGIVCNIVDFGAFVDLGGVDGLVHISELDWQHVDHPSDVLSVGDEVEVYVLNVDRDRERIGLSRKRLLPDPWDEVTKDLQWGMVVEGTITNVMPFGVFVEIGKGVEGLVHNSQIPNEKALAVELEEGTRVKVRVLDVDKQRHQIALRLEGPAPDAESESDEPAEPETPVEAEGADEDTESESSEAVEAEETSESSETEEAEEAEEPTEADEPTEASDESE